MIGVVGTGTWGTAMAAIIARRHHRVCVWGRDPAKVAALRKERQHPKLAGVRIPDAVQFSDDPACLRDCEWIFWAVPTQYSAAVATKLAAAMHPQAKVVSLSKGLERESLRRVTEILSAGLGPRPFAVLSGPSHAEEVSQGQPAGLVAAGADDLPSELVTMLHHDQLRIYTSHDIVGVELGGALKNVIAVAAGIVDGLRLGDNVKATLVTRGLAEMRRLGRALNADDATFAGLAGIGDLLTTCYSPFGRNRSLGMAVATGQTLDDFAAQTGMIAEGAWTSRAALDLGRRHGVELPIAEQVEAVLWQQRPVAEAMGALLNRSAKEENA